MIVAREATLAMVGRGARRGWGAGGRVFGLSRVRWLARCAQRAGGKKFGFKRGKSVKATSLKLT